MLNGYSANLPKDVLLDMGILRIASATIGVTKGAPRWEPNDEFQNVDFDGKHAPILGLDRTFHGEPKISGVLMEFGDSSSGNQIPKLLPGSSSATAGSPAVTTITPKIGGGFLASGDYLTDVRLIFERAELTGTKQYACIYLPKAVVVKWDLQGNPAGDRHATISFEIVGRKDMASGATADAAYKIELREALP